GHLGKQGPLKFSLRHEVARLIVWHAVSTRPVVPSTVTHEPGLSTAYGNSQIPSDLVVKSQVTDIIDLLLQLIRHPNGVQRSCHHRKSRSAVLSTSAVQWATTKFDGVWKILEPVHH